MKTKHKKVGSVSNSNDQAIIDAFLRDFANQHPDIRKRIAETLPAYHQLLDININANTFESFALLHSAKEQGLPCDDPLFDLKGVFPCCPFCKSAEYISKEKENLYRCRRCTKTKGKSVKFAANYNSISSDRHIDCGALTWMRVLQCLIHGDSIHYTCLAAGINESTYYRIRNRLFYAMQLFMDEVHLYGEIQCDITYENASYRGGDLGHEEYPEDSPFGKPKYVHRDARKRGGANQRGNNVENSVAIFTAYDGMHTVARIAGFGHATATKLQKAISGDKYLLTVPETDPFPFTYRTLSSPLVPGQKSKLIGDGELCINKYADQIGIDFEPRYTTLRERIPSDFKKSTVFIHAWTNFYTSRTRRPSI